MGLFWNKQNRNGQGDKSHIPFHPVGTNNRNYNSDVAKRVPLIIGVYNAISDSFAQTPIKVYTEGPNGEPVPVALPKWLKKPNANQTAYEFKESLAQSLLYYGNAYIYKLGKGRAVKELHILHPHNVIVDPLDGFGRKQFIVQTAQGQQIFSQSEILHIKMYAGPEDLYGYSPVQRAQQLVCRSASAEDYATDLYDSNLNLKVVIETPADLKVEQAERVRDSFAATHSTKANGPAVAVLGGGATLKPVTLTPQEAQFVESEKWNAQVFATLLNVPLFMVDASAGSWAGTGLEVMNLFYEQRTLQPFTKRIEEALSEFLLPDSQYVKFNLDAILRSSTNERYNAHTKAIASGWKTRNEVRALEGLAPLDGLDEPIVPQWMFDVEDQKKQAQLNQQKTQKEIKNVGDDSPGGKE